MALSHAEILAELTAPGQSFEVGEATIRNVPTRVFLRAPNHLGEVLNLSRGWGERVFIVYEDERVTFSGHWQRAAAFAHRLREHWGVTKGDRVAIAMRNFPEWPVAFFGAAAAGAVVVPLNAWWKGDELAFALSDSGTSLLVADSERLERLGPERLRSLEREGLRHVVVVRAHTDAWPRAEMWADEIQAAPSALPEVDLGPEDDATIFYTSGTTGKPKGAVGTHRNSTTAIWNIFYVVTRAALRAGKAASTGSGEGEPSSYLLAIPLFHATGCQALLLPNLLAGGKLVLMHHFEPRRALELIERERINSIGGVPTIAWQIVNDPDFNRYDTSSVTSISYGGAPAPPELVRRLRQAFPLGVPSNGYGLTETSALSTMNSGQDYVDKPTSVGLPTPVVELRVVGQDGTPLPPGEPGELWIKGPNVVRGYWRRPEETDETFTDGWLHTGDIATVDDEGFLTIVDRAKDMVIRGGENVYSVEVEDVLYEHPDVLDATVVGLPHPVLGEEVVAVVLRRPGSKLAEAQLQEFVGERLAAFKVPSRIVFTLEPLPRNPAGKVLKRELRETLAPRH
jgi:long-chain acyl-CoA synthetase